MTNQTIFRVHPTVNFARFGTSDEYYLSPETSAGMPIKMCNVTGGLPIQIDDDGNERFIKSSDLRDRRGHLKRQAARFKLFVYDDDNHAQYPQGSGREITIGSTLSDGRVVKDIVWTVHVANKKSAAYNIVPSQGINSYKDGKVPQLRNPGVYGDFDSVERLKKLMIDPGPRAIQASCNTSAQFSANSSASYVDENGIIQAIPNYPISFPADHYSRLYEPSGALDSLGEMQTDEKGRLLVLAAKGKTAAKYDEYGDYMPLTGDLNNEGWFDDAADGPVSATIIFEDDSTQNAFGAWVVCGDPSYAPQIRNVVSVWDDVYDAWIRELDLQPEIYDSKTKQFNPDYEPYFDSMLRPIFIAPALQRWTTNIPEMAVKAHDTINAITADDDPNQTIMAGLTFMRNPNKEEDKIGVPLMPLSLGDAGQPFLSVSKTQYFFLNQWSQKKFSVKESPRLGEGEMLDMASLSNCLGGRYVPGIEVSYTIRSPEIYYTDWKTSGAGTFRIKPQTLDYQNIEKGTPFLTGGWLPERNQTDGLQPGDLSKFMAVPWQTDYNSCSIHPTTVNTSGKNEATGNASTLYWSWPSQRPDAVYVSHDVVDNVLPAQKWAIRGKGTYAANPMSASTFQKALQAVEQWDRIGFVLQGSAIDDGDYSANFYLEVQDQFDVKGITTDPVLAWPFNSDPHKHK